MGGGVAEECFDGAEGEGKILKRIALVDGWCFGYVLIHICGTVYIWSKMDIGGISEPGQLGS